MNEKTIEEITVVLDLLKGCLMKNGVSMALEFHEKEIMFFDTSTYLNEGRFSGIKVNVDDLVGTE